tara:strand:- start:316 stop:1251 length:936 start_codon:yes stop_codon:yes gene_type:complete
MPVRYSLTHFKKRENGICDISQIIDDDTIKKINYLAQLVGAPEYQKTPIFKKNDDRYRKRQPVRTTTVEDWESMRNFKATVLTKSVDDIDKQLDEIRMLLNKITKKNYEDMHKLMIEQLNKFMESTPSEEDLLKIGTSIFEIGSMNKFWSSLYAQLFKDIIKIFPIMNSIYMKNIESFMGLFDDIRYVSAEENYDTFCLINKENEKRRSLSSFFVNLMKCDVLNVDILGNIVLKLINMFNDKMNDVLQKEIINELGENICIILQDGLTELEESYKDYNKIGEFITKISQANHKDYGGLTSKVVFKFLDIVE